MDGSNLKFDGPKGKGFKICSKDGDYKEAEVEIIDNKVIVYNKAIKYPVAVSYGWGNFVEVNLYNAEDLPASPFRTKL
ncbi:MAG TPA: hypothetical protein VIK72_15220 [Clostridiaceae bacterium]